MVSTRYETCDWLPIKSIGVFSTYVAEHIGLISARPSDRRQHIHLQNKKRYKLVINWCHYSPPSTEFGAPSMTTQIFPTHMKQNTRTCMGLVTYTLPCAAAPLTLVSINQLYALPHQFWKISWFYDFKLT